MKILKQTEEKMVIETKNGGKVVIDEKLNFIKIVSSDIMDSRVAVASSCIDSEGNIQHVNVHPNFKDLSKKKTNRKNHSITELFPKGGESWDSICNIFTNK